VAGTGKRRWGCSPGRITFLAPLIALSAFLAPPAAAAPFEPNDSILSATGPLALGQTYTAALEAQGDRDFFYFYVTSSDTSQVAFTVQNLGGGGEFSDVKVTILDVASTPLASQAFIGDGEQPTISAALAPQKYFVEVGAQQGFGDSYNLSAGGGPGAFGPYLQIAGRCARATEVAVAARNNLEKAKGKLQRTTARLRRSRYATPRARQRALAAQRKASAWVKTERRALNRAGKSQEPWCSILQ
jgi:hypothetical protein